MNCHYIVGTKRILHLSKCEIFLIFFYRLFFCVSVKTVDAPDEWWQSNEVAYRMVYGKGHLPWEWHVGLRSVVFPCILAVPFFVLKHLGLDSAWAVWFVPRLVQAFIITAIDIYTFRLGSLIDAELEKEKAKTSKITSDVKGLFIIASLDNLFGKKRQRISVAYFALTLSLTNWYVIFACVRMYSNVLEMLFVLLALQEENYVRFLFISGIACTIRITSAVALLPLVVFHFLRAVRKQGKYKGFVYSLSRGLFVFVIVFGCMVLLDSFFYQRWVITPYAFLKFNVLQNASRFFGEHGPFFYLFPSLPALLGPHIFFLFCAPLVLWRGNARRRLIIRVCGLFMFSLVPFICYSLIAHKEARFILLVFPIYFVIIGFVLLSLYSKSFVIRKLHLSFIFLNFVVAFFAGYVYRRGPLNVMQELRNGPTINRVDIVLKCYTTPGYSFVHGKVNHLSITDCSMRLNNETGLPELTEDNMFLQSAKDYVLWKYDGVHTFNTSDPKEKVKADKLERTVMQKSAQLPDVIVLYRNLAINIKNCFLDKHNYTFYRSFFHSPLVLYTFEDFYIEMWLRKVT